MRSEAPEKRGAYSRAWCAHLDLAPASCKTIGLEAPAAFADRAWTQSKPRCEGYET